MELQEKRDLFVKKLRRFLKDIDFNDMFWTKLEEHQKNEYIASIKDFKDNEMAQKVFIFLEFTRSRATCKKMIQILRDSNLKKAALKLEEFNKSPGIMEVVYDLDLKVTKSSEVKEGTDFYKMQRKIRGKCIIINNVQEIFKESYRFQSIFEQLQFDVELGFQMTTKRINQRLIKLSEDSILSESDAFIVMIISHGRDERVLGYNDYSNYNPDDEMKISDIVNIFSENNCKCLKNKPKLFFFTCCRGSIEFNFESSIFFDFRILSHELLKDFKLRRVLDKVGTTKAEILIEQLSDPVHVKASPSTDSSQVFEIPSRSPAENKGNADLKIILEWNTIDQKWINNNQNTFICYACAEGEKAFYDESYSHFGQALSHSIAQFACEKDLFTIIARTSALMDKRAQTLYGETYRTSPEIRALKMAATLFFNPGKWTC